jgi:pimeloyl-ACP methyl ester carboxylesterase
VSADQRTVELAQGAIRYRDLGQGEPIVFVHGLLVDGRLWDGVAAPLSERFRCVVPDLPLGSHRVAMRADADLSPAGLARIVHDLLAALDLDGVTLVGNDTGGAISQLVAAHHRERLARLVLTPCDAYENFLPPFFRPLQWAARVPGLWGVLIQLFRLGPLQRSALGFGLLTKRRPLDAELLDDWLRAGIEDPGVRRDVVKVLRGIHKRYTLEAAERLRTLDRPTLLAWAPEDGFFKLRYAERLADEIPNARLETVADSRTLMPLDQPDRLAELIEAFILETSAPGGA